MASFGLSLSLVDGFEGTFPTVEGPRVVLEAVYRRWTTAPESLPGRRIYNAQCFDLGGLLASRLSGALLSQLGQVLAEIARYDERVEDCIAVALYEDKKLVIRAEVQVGDQVYPLVILVDNVTVELLTDGV